MCLKEGTGPLAIQTYEITNKSELQTEIWLAATMFEAHAYALRGEWGGKFEGGPGQT